MKFPKIELTTVVFKFTVGERRFHVRFIGGTLICLDIDSDTQARAYHSYNHKPTKARAIAEVRDYLIWEECQRLKTHMSTVKEKLNL